MKNLLIIYPHWPPSNLVGMHRVRLIANFLHEFGWHPMVLTVHPDHYEEKPDPALEKTVSPEVEVIRAPAAPVLRLFGKRLVGDIGLRAFFSLYRAALRLLRARQVDFIWISIPSWYTALLGPLLHRKTRTPYGIDYQDPWVSRLAPYHGRFSKAWFSLQLARILEPIAVRRAALITGVAEAYYADVLRRNFAHRPMHHAAMPLGFDSRDHRIDLPDMQPPWSAHEQAFVYAGAFLPQSHLFIRHLFQAAARLRESGAWPAPARLYFLGTGFYGGTTIAEYARQAGVGDLVVEIRERFPFLHILQFLSAAAGVMIIGSTERHYTASKTFQCLLSGRPVFAMLHEASSAAAILAECRADAYLLRYNEAMDEPSLQDDTQAALERYLHARVGWSPDLKALEPYSARASAQALANALEKVLSA